MHPANSIGSVLKSARSPLGACLLLLCILCGMQPVAGQGTQPTRSFYHVDNGVTYAVLVYESPGTFSFTPPAGVTSVDYLIVGGGGGGAGQGNNGLHYNPGGGGAGGLLQGTFSVSNSLYTIAVGGGGLGSGNVGPGTNGENSSAFGFTAFGGGGGGGGAGLAGGSGGGGGFQTQTGGSGTVGQGFNGGASFGGGTIERTGGGGGGAGQAGAAGVNSVGGKGGNGLDFSTMFSIDVGANGWFAGGGGGSSQNNQPGLGGTGGGGNGATTSRGGNGQIGTGGGGGGASSFNGGGSTNAFGGNGGGGVVIVRYAASSGLPDVSQSSILVSPQFGLLANNNDEAQVQVILRDSNLVQINTQHDVFLTNNLGSLSEQFISGADTSFIYTADGSNGIQGRTYRVEIFNRVGTRNITINRPIEVEYLIIGGGGSGGPTFHGAGGGAGGYRSSVVGAMSGGGGSAEPTLTLNQGIYQVTVGAGGIGGTNNGDGSNSSFSNIVALGGGGGNGRNGGSGSGTVYGNASVGLGSVNQGFNGGTGVMSSAPPHYGSGGGGGAGGAGGTGTNVSGGNGGLGLSSTITGVPLTRAGGGGGSTYNGGTPGTGSAGGGNGSSGQGTAAAPNSGSGGGGSERFGGGQGGAGGSGIVILRYEVATGASLGGQTFTLKTPTAGRATITAYLGTDATGTLIGTAQVDFIDPAKFRGGTGRGDGTSPQTSPEVLVETGPPVASQSSIEATPRYGLVANNSDEAQVRVILRDANGTQITAIPHDVFLSTSLGTLSTTQFTNGVYLSFLKTPTAGQATITAYLGTDATGTLIGTAQVDFIDPDKFRGGTGRGDGTSPQTSPEALVETGPPVASQSSIEATPRYGLVANNSDEAQVRVILRDASGTQITAIQHDVFLSTSLGTLSTTQFTNGVYLSFLKTPTAGQATITAYLGTDASGTLIGTAQVDFIDLAKYRGGIGRGDVVSAQTSPEALVETGPPVASQSSVEATPRYGLVANNSDEAQVRVTLRDASGTQITAFPYDVFLSTSSGTLSTTQFTNGVYLSPLKTPTPGQATITAYLGTSDSDPRIGTALVDFIDPVKYRGGIGRGDVASAQTSPVPMVETGAPVAIQASIEATPRFGKIANNSDEATIRVTLRDANGVIVINNSNPVFLTTNLGSFSNSFSAAGDSTYTYIGDGTNGIAGETYVVHLFRNSGSFQVTNQMNVDYLIVAGGGAGGLYGLPNGGTTTGGGGGGGVLEFANQIINPSSYSILVGQGGLGTAPLGSGNGGNSSAFEHTAFGGGRGASGTELALAGGSGGGGAGTFQSGGTSGALGSIGQGSKGGNGLVFIGDPSVTIGGGGGGAASLGGNSSYIGSGSKGGNGGEGKISFLMGVPYYFGGGGGGGMNRQNWSTGGSGGLGGGGGGGHHRDSGSDCFGCSPGGGGLGGINLGLSGSNGFGGNGGEYTGGGGGGSGGSGQWGGGAGNGGSGIVVIRYLRLYASAGNIQGSNGLYEATIKSLMAGQATITAYLGTDATGDLIGSALVDFIDPVKYRGSIGRGDVASVQTSPEALVETGIPVVAQAILEATPRLGLLANNSDEAQIRVILRDANGIQITGTQHDVFLTTDLGGLTSSGVIGGDSTYTYVGNGTNGTLGETYVVHVFRNPGSQLLQTVSSLNVDYLLVAGGGGGGSDMGGGGGSGGVLQGSTVLSPNRYNLFVGGGGPGAVGYNNTPPPGANGSNSTAFGFTAIGGGGGSSGHRTDGTFAGPPPTIGGSGGGSAARYMYSGAGQSFGAAGTPGQGTRGGNSPTVNNDYYAGGGGGAGSNTEVDAINGTRSGNGGNGVSSVIMSTAYFFGGGGGGAGHTGGPAGNGGQGGGGGGSRWTGGVVGIGGTGGLNNGTNGANAYSKGGNGGRNTGSGGGGGSHQGPGGDGGSGIVIIRYKLSEVGTSGLTAVPPLLNGEYRATLKSPTAGRATISAYLGSSTSDPQIGTALLVDFIDPAKYRGGNGRGDSRQAPSTAFNLVPDMGLTVNTQALGTSPDRTVALPLRGNTNVLIEWGDGNTTSVTNANQTTDVQHTYATDGIYPISISGLLSQFGNGTGSGYAHADKIVAVNSLVSRDLSSLSGAFNGAVNLTEVPTYLMPNITNLNAAFKGATAFDQDISGWNITSVTNMADMFLGVTLSPEVYSSILTGWGAQVVQANVSFHGGNSKYFLGAAMLGRKKLTDPVGSAGYNWTITDGGPILPEESIWYVPETGLVNKGFSTGLSLKYNSGQEYLYNGEITISLASGTGTLSGGVIASSTGGQFAFRELLLDATGVFTFQASIAYHHNVPQTYTTTVSSAITIVQSAFFGGQGRGEALAESPMINLEGKRRLTIEGTFTAANKIFDGTRAATILTNNMSLVGIISPDVVVGTFSALFNSPTIGLNKLVSPLVSLSGADTANYFVSYLNAPTTTASILGAHYFGGDGKGDDMDFSSLSTLNGDRFFSWIGGFAGDTKNWFNPGNWSPPALPASTDFVQIESTAHQPMISGSSPGQDVERTGLTTISNGATLTLTPGPVLTFTSAAEFNTEGTGRIILEPGASYVNESASEPTLEVQQVITGQKGWRMLGSPLKGITYSNLLTGLAPQGMGGLSSPFTSLQPNVLWFNETDGGTTLQSWRKPTNVGNTVSLGRGHYVYVFNGASIPGGLGTYGDPLPVTLRATGKEHNFLNSGAVNFGITYTPRTTPLIQPDLEEELYIETNPADAGFNMVANPTASVIDFYQADAWTKTNLDNSIYVWDPSMNSHAGSWRIFNGTTGNLDNGRIAPYQAFWVRTNAASPMLSLNSSQAKTLLPKSYYSRMAEEDKSAKNAEILTLPFHVKGEGMMAESWLSFDPNGKPGQDPRDAYQLESLSDDWLLLYTYGSQNHRTPLQINNQDYLSGEEKSIPLMLAAAKSEKEFSGSYTLSWKVPTNWPQGVSLTLMDHTKERAVDMLDQESYGFVFEAPKLPGARVNLLRSGMKSPGPVIFDSPFDSGDPSARISRPDLSKRPFTIRIGSYVPGKGLDYLPDFPKLYPPIPNSFSREVKIRFYIPYAMTAQVRITDVTGRVVQDFGVGDYAGGTYELEFVDEADRLASGFYMVQLLTKDHLLNQKLIKLN